MIHSVSVHLKNKKFDVKWTVVVFTVWLRKEPNLREKAPTKRRLRAVSQCIQTTAEASND